LSPIFIPEKPPFQPSASVIPRVVIKYPLIKMGIYLTYY
jgi:hypothetical protein